MSAIKLLDEVISPLRSQVAVNLQARKVYKEGQTFINELITAGTLLARPRAAPSGSEDADFCRELKNWEDRRDEELRLKFVPALRRKWINEDIFFLIDRVEGKIQYGKPVVDSLGSQKEKPKKKRQEVAATLLEETSSALRAVVVGVQSVAATFASLAQQPQQPQQQPQHAPPANFCTDCSAPNFCSLRQAVLLTQLSFTDICPECCHKVARHQDREFAFVK